MDIIILFQLAVSLACIDIVSDHMAAVITIPDIRICCRSSI